MRLPHLSFLYRLECNISPTEIHVGAPHNSGAIRTIMPITGGLVQGPRLSATVLSTGAADWACTYRGTHSMKLEAKYLLKTDDGWHILVNSNGLYRPGPGTQYAETVAREGGEMKPPSTVTQDDVEFFTHVSFETAGEGPYNCLNGLVCIGVLQCVEEDTEGDGERIVLDCYALTNFPGREPESVVVR